MKSDFSLQGADVSSILQGDSFSDLSDENKIVFGSNRLATRGINPFQMKCEKYMKDVWEELETFDEIMIEPPAAPSRFFAKLPTSSGGRIRFEIERENVSTFPKPCRPLLKTGE